MESKVPGDGSNPKNSMHLSSTQLLDTTASEIEQLSTILGETAEFTESMQKNFQHLSESLADLEYDRQELHDKLEVQTINASIKRHTLKNLPEDFQRQLETAVLAARNGNASMIEWLQSQMKITTEATKETLLKQQTLQKENAIYLPERDIVTRQHDELIAALNQRMADKASTQIKLNETKDHLRETTSSVNEFELGMQNLKEDMTAFNEESSAEQSKLESEIIKTQEAIKLQNQKNSEEKQSTDQVLDKIISVNARLDIVLKDVRRTENSKARLEMQSIQLAETINREILLNQDTAEEVVMLEAEQARHNLGYEEKIQELGSKIYKAEAEYKKVLETHQQLSKEKDEIFLRKEEIHRKKSKAQASVREIGREVQVIKQRTTDQVEKSARISQENNQCQEDLQGLDENHNATVETFNQQITDYQSNLAAETTEKKKAQDEQEHAEKILDDFRADQLRFMNDMTQKIEAGRREHRQLAQRSSEYQRSVASNVKKVGQLKVELDVSEKSLQRMRKEITMEIERLKMSIELCTTENKRKEIYLGEKRPVVKDLEKDLEEMSDEYTRLKNDVVGVRNRQKSIQEQINRTQVLVDRLDKPYQKLKSDLKSCRLNQLVQISEFAQELKKVDTELYEGTKKMECVVDENTRFKASSTEKEESILDLMKDIKAHGSYQNYLLVKLKQLQKSFMEAWNVCVAMEFESAENDARLLESIRTLQEETKERGIILTKISENLITEMDTLTGFLENVNSRRPQDTRQDKRVSILPTPPSSRPNLLSKPRKGSSAFKSQSRKSISLAPPGTPSQQPITAR